jgi:hypothetical protein
VAKEDVVHVKLQRKLPAKVPVKPLAPVEVPVPKRPLKKVPKNPANTNF